MPPVLATAAGRDEPAVDAARRLLLKAGAYTVPAIVATAMTATNVYASGNQGNQGNQNNQGNQGNQGNQNNQGH
jgi:hypothetical protein